MREAGQVSCASAIAAMRRSTLCLLLGLLGAAPPGQAAGFDFASLQSLLSHQDIGSVEELIAALPAAQRNRYALVFESRSLQGASPENPRVILYGPDARFIVTFSGSPAQRGFRVVETMEFDDDSKEFRLRELLFPERAAGPDKVVVSEVNPQRCTRCHGAPPRPVWDTFPLWPGAYGERYRATLSARQRPGLERFARDTAATNARQAQLKAARAASGGGAAVAADGGTSDNSLMQLRFVAESALGIATQNWTLALEKGTYDFTMPSLPAQPLRETLLAEVAARDAAVRDLSLYRTSSDGDRYCSYLKRRSRAALTPAEDGAQGVIAPDPTSPLARAGAAPAIGALANAPAAASITRPAALQLCVNCHETGVAPQVPFSSPAQLMQQLRVRPSAHGTLIDEIRFRLSAAAGAQHMPLGLNLSDADRESLEAYFAALAASSN